MFGTIRRHQAWLWVIIAAITIISFVIFGPTNTKLGNAMGNRGSLGTIDGKPITREQYLNASRDVQLGYFISNGRWPDTDPNARRMGYSEERQTYQRLFILSKLQEYGIHPSPQAVAEMAREMLGNKISLDQFVDQGLKPHGFDAGDFERFLQHETGIQQLLSVAGLSGKLVTPQEAKELYVKEHQDVSASMVYFSASNYMAGITLKPEDVQQFFNQRSNYYSLPERVQVNYVEFNLSNYVAQVQARMTNIDQEVESYYQKAGTNAYPGAKTPQEAKAKLKEEAIHENALLEARRAAGEFAEKLDSLPQKNASALETLAKEKGLKVSTTAPFSRDEAPQGMDVPETFMQTAFGLTPEEPFGGPIVAPRSAAYVIALKQRFPREVPPFKNVEAKVTADYRFLQALQKAQMEGYAFANALTNGLAQNKSFASIAADARVKPIQLPPFSLSTRSLPADIEDKVSLSTLKEAVFTTPEGKASRFIPTRQGGFVVYVDKHLPIDQSKMDSEFPEFLAYVRQARQGDAFNQWFVKQLDRDPAFKAVLARSMQESQMGARAGRAPRS
jgi:SurA-like N-terminal domain